MNDSKLNETLRITLTVTICMLAGKLMGLNSPVYLALYPVIVMTKGKDYSLKGLVKMFAPVLCAASLALWFVRFSRLIHLSFGQSVYCFLIL